MCCFLTQSEWAKTAKVTDVLADELIPSFNFSGKCGKISLIGQPFYIIWKSELVSYIVVKFINLKSYLHFLHRCNDLE